MIIDTHHHLWNYNPVEFDWIDNEMSDVRRSFLPKNLLSTLENTGVQGVVTVQARQSIEETNWLLQLASEYSVMKGIVGWLPLANENIDQLLEQYSENFLLKGIRHVVQGEFNDDPGAKYPGWMRRSNLGTGDYNNDLTFSDTPGDVWSCSFTGSSVTIIAPKEEGAGKIEVQVDGQTQATADLSTSGTRLPQQVVSKITDLTPGDHTISIINRGGGLVAVDAIMVQ